MSWLVCLIDALSEAVVRMIDGFFQVLDDALVWGGACVPCRPNSGLTGGESLIFLLTFVRFVRLLFGEGGYGSVGLGRLCGLRRSGVVGRSGLGPAFWP